MNPFSRALIAGGVAAVLPSAAFAAWGNFASFAILEANGGGNTYYDLASTTGNPDFQGASLGSFNPSLGNSLLFEGAQIKTWQNGGDNVGYAEVNYRVWSGSPSGSFTALSLPWQSDGPSAGDKTWERANGGVNLLNALPNGNYSLEVYLRYTRDGGGQDFVNNGGNNYAATFSVVPEPASLGLLGLASVGLVRRRRA